MGCSKKILTKAEAVSKLVFIRSKQNHRSVREKIPRRFYYCQECEGFHLTSQTIKEFYKYLRMTNHQKRIIDLLMEGDHYLRLSQADNKRKACKLYKGNALPVMFVHYNSFNALRHLLKKDGSGRFTLNFTSVRQQRKNSYPKSQYLKLKSKTKNSEKV